MKEKSTHHADAIARVAEAIDNALCATVRVTDNDEEANLDVILLTLAEARAYVVIAALQASVTDRIVDVTVPNDQQRVYADELAPTPNKEKLPKLKPQGHEQVKYKPGISKLFKQPIKFDCPKCHAQNGTFCFKFDGPGAHPKLTTERNDGSFYHEDRQVLSRAYNDRIRKQNILQ